MSRLAVLLIIALIVIGALFFLSTLPRQQSTRTIEVGVTNAH
jgi:hypothetical protein